MLKKMGSLRDVMERLPFFSDALADGMKFDDKELVRIEAIIQSMTPGERKKPEVLNARRVQRIARGCGRKPQDVLDLVQRYEVMRQMMARIGQAPGLLSRLPGFGQMSQLAKLKGGGVDGFFDEIEKMAGPNMNPAQMAQALRGMGGMPGGLAGGLADAMPGGMPAGMMGLPGMAGFGAPQPKLPPRREIDRDDRKKKNKQAAAARKKNRRK
jgi:signal recognition particle subunit SRP54